MKLSLGYQVLIAVFLGIGCGIFFGPICSAVQPVGEVYVTMLQMVALPYIGLSLVHGIGSMTPSLCKKLLKKGWIFWVAIWAVAFAMIYFLYLLIPAPASSVIEVGEDRSLFLAKSFLSYLVPENPFYDLVNNIVPAIASSGLIFGAALMHLRKKEPVLSFLERSTEMIEKILTWLAIVSPIGIFARLASTFGTIKFEDVFAFQFYVLAFVGASLFLTIWVLPALVSSLTPLSYREVLKATKTVCLLPFATALPTIALPFIILYMKKLGSKQVEGSSRFHITSQTVLPVCYSFGQIGNCMILFFIFFLSFFFRHPFTISEKAVLSLFTLPMSVGSSTTSISAVSFLTGQLNFPKESIELFMQTLSITMNFQVLVSSASILCLIILVLYSYYGLLQIKWKTLLINSLLTVSFLAISLEVLHSTVHLQDNFQNQYMDLKITDVIEDPVSVKISKSLREQTGKPKSNKIFSDILSSGILRVGYSPVDTPYSYFNEHGELVGYDIAFAYQLAKDLDCSLEFVLTDYKNFDRQVENREFDIAMSGILLTEDRIRIMDFTKPYRQENIVLVVPSSKQNEFMNVSKITQDPNLRIRVVGAFEFLAKRHFPMAQIIADESDASLVDGNVDAWLTIRMEGFVWTLSHPDFTLIDYRGALGQRYLAYAIPSGSEDWLTFLNNWLVLKEQSGFKEEMTRYWLQGESLQTIPRRWSIIRNVLHWVD